jgi:glycosidase
MPIHPSPSYHGYDVTDYYAVNPDYGSLDDLKRLLDECHKRGIRVIIDMVLNHTSSDHPWFTEARDNFQSTHRDWYIWSGADPGYLGPWNEQVWYPSISGFYYAIFWVKMPDLNYTNTDVTNEINNVARYWLKDVGLDGFRLDAARYLVEEGKNQAVTASTHAWWAGFRTGYKDAKPDSMTVGEVWTTNYSVVNYVKGDELDMAFNFDLASQIMSNVSNRNAANLGPIIQSSYNLFKAGTYATFLTNHDQERVMSFFEKNKIWHAWLQPSY